MRTIGRCAALAAVLCLSKTALAAPGPLTLTLNPNVPDSVVTTYNPMDGMLTVKGNNVVMTTYQLESTNALFDAGRIESDFCPVFDCVPTSKKLFTLRTDGVIELTIGPILPPQLTPEELLADLTIDGSLQPSGNFTAASGGGPYLYVVPEPSGILLLLTGLLFAIRSFQGD